MFLSENVRNLKKNPQGSALSIENEVWQIDSNWAASSGRSDKTLSKTKLDTEKAIPYDLS